MMVPILVASIVAIALILEAWWVLSRSRSRFEDLRDWRGPLPKGKRTDLFSVLLVWLHSHPDAAEEEQRSHAEVLLGALERKIGWLSTIAAIAPLLGLLGTVSGMIANFAMVAMTRPTDPLNQLSRGISEALVSTAGGLIVAIIAALGHHGLTNSLETFGIQLGAYLKGLRPGRIEARPEVPSSDPAPARARNA
ncbi:MAG: MotA/TolQ/ExbB proton channel family protein [Cyanobacteria bacterium REEB65]|nr:MotA/TolQ/ExbB proton channel family protein [Cyanobacteria bacterium REEB65]